MTDKIDNGGPAFPTTSHLGAYSHGMSLRDWFAGQALAGLVSSSEEATKDLFYNAGTNSVSVLSYELADAMLAARSAK